MAQSKVEFNREDIAGKLPHTGPLLLLDSIVIDMSEESKTAIATKTILPDDIFMKHHSWAYPGVLLEECANQAAALFAILKFENIAGMPLISGNNGKSIGVSAQIGDKLIISVTLKKKKMGFFFFDAVITNQDWKEVMTVSNITGTAQKIS